MTTIFYEVALRLIRSECQAAIKSSEKNSEGPFSSLGREERLSTEKRRLLKALLAELQAKPECATDQDSLGQLQELLLNYKEKVVAATKDRKFTDKDTPGSTEPMLGHLSDSLQPTYSKLSKMNLLNKTYNHQDALDIFYCLNGLYLANRMLKEKQDEALQEAQQSLQSKAARYLAERVERVLPEYFAEKVLRDPKPFVQAQKELVARFFILCPARIRAWDGVGADEPAPVGATTLAQSERACKILAFVNNLGKRHQTLINEQGAWVAQSDTVSFYSTMLNKWLAEATKELETVWEIDSDLTAYLADDAVSEASSDHSLTSAALARHDSRQKPRSREVDVESMLSHSPPTSAVTPPERRRANLSTPPPTQHEAVRGTPSNPLLNAQANSSRAQEDLHAEEAPVEDTLAVLPVTAHKEPSRPSPRPEEQQTATEEVLFPLETGETPLPRREESIATETATETASDTVAADSTSLMLLKMPAGITLPEIPLPVADTSPPPPPPSSLSTSVTTSTSPIASGGGSKVGGKKKNSKQSGGSASTPSRP